MYKQGKSYAFAATGFLYSVIIVDLYRKLNGVNVEGIRNLVYIFFFALLLIDMYKSRNLKPMLAIGGVVMLLFLFSIIINPGNSAVYIPSIFMFVSRMWPAYYIGRYTEDWDYLCKNVLLFSPIAVVYAASLFILPDLSEGAAYATIASNLAFVSLIALFASIYFKKKYVLPLSIFCLVPVFFYGTRVFFLGVIISLLLAYMVNSNKVSYSKRVLLISLLIAIFAVFQVFGDEIFNHLYQWFPDSRTLKMIAGGDLMDDSNRSIIYDKIIAHLDREPLSMLGLIGDRIYLAGPGASPIEILSEFSHNSSLELCMDFGVPIGIVLNVIFMTKLISALRLSFIYHNSISYIYVLFLGAGLLNLMVSASFMSEYTAWLLFGLAFRICNKSVLIYKQ